MRPIINGCNPIRQIHVRAIIWVIGKIITPLILVVKAENLLTLEQRNWNMKTQVSREPTMLIITVPIINIITDSNKEMITWSACPTKTIRIIDDRKLLTRRCTITERDKKFHQTTHIHHNIVTDRKIKKNPTNSQWARAKHIEVSLIVMAQIGTIIVDPWVAVFYQNFNFHWL